MEALNTLQSNFAAVAAVRKLGPAMHKNAIPEMIDWCRRTGYEVWVTLSAHWAMATSCQRTGQTPATRTGLRHITDRQGSHHTMTR